MLFSECRQLADGRCGRVAAADEHDAAARVEVLLLAEDVFEAVRNRLAGRDLADGREAAIAQPVRRRVGSRAIENRVGSVDAFRAARRTHQQAERQAIVGLGLLQTCGAAELQHHVLRVHRFDERFGFGERHEVRIAELPAGEQIAFGRNVLGPFFAKQCGHAERRDVRSERREHADVAPAQEMLADLAAFVHGHGVPAGLGVQGRLDPDGTGPEHGNPLRKRFGHPALVEIAKPQAARSLPDRDRFVQPDSRSQLFDDRVEPLGRREPIRAELLGPLLFLQQE